MAVTLAELAVKFGCDLRGDPQRVVSRVATLEAATADCLCFLSNPKLIAQLRSTRAGAVVLAQPALEHCPVDALIAINPHAAFARMAQLLHRVPDPKPGIHPTAQIAASATVDPSAAIAAQVVIGEACRIGANCAIDPGVVLGSGVTLGEGCRIHARAVLYDGVTAGARCIVHSGAVIGADGFGYAADNGQWIKVPQIGSVVIGDDVEIGANTTIDRGALGDTVIETGVKLDNLIQIGHNVHIGAHTAMAACVGVSGSVRIGERCQIGGAVGIAGHLQICDDVIVTGLSLVSHSISQAGVYSSGIPVEPVRDWRRTVGRLKRIEHLADRVTRLERAGGGTDTTDPAGT
ncbi:MAG: UDP-3-O-(3-hydroxymyristoyl)glucosamine N-acyltransferase [Steroidobacteraceae bacterium]